jgi:hypothetical protein
MVAETAFIVAGCIPNDTNVIDHGILAGKYLAEYRNSLK